MIKKRILICLASLILIIPLISAAECPPGLGDEWICGSGEVLFRIDEGFFCKAPDFDMWEDSIGGKLFPTIAEVGQPVFSCLDPLGSNSCCPEGSVCEKGSTPVYPLPEGTDTEWTCMASLASFCSDFETEESCENSSTQWIAKNSIENAPEKGKGYCDSDPSEVSYIDGVGCWNETSCSCEWENNTCIARDFKFQNCTDGTVTNWTDCDYDVITIDNCQIDESIHISWEIVNGKASECTLSDVRIPCTNIMRLEFFNLFNLISVLLILLGIYVFILIKNN